MRSPALPMDFGGTRRTRGANRCLNRAQTRAHTKPKPPHDADAIAKYLLMLFRCTPLYNGRGVGVRPCRVGDGWCPVRKQRSNSNRLARPNLQGVAAATHLTLEIFSATVSTLSWPVHCTCDNSISSLCGEGNHLGEQENTHIALDTCDCNWL